MTKSEKTRQFIVEKTAPIFNKKGYAGTSLSDLTQATGLTKGSIYGNFSNKDEVALAVFDYNLLKLNNGIAAVTEGEENAITKLLLMTRFYRTQIKEVMANGGCPILNTATDADDTHPQLKAKVAQGIKSWKKNIENILKEGITNNEVSAAVDPAEFAVEFISLIEGGIFLSKATGDISLLNIPLNRLEKIINTELKT